MWLASGAEGDGRPSVSDLIGRAAKIAAIARERAVETEQARRVSSDLVAEMRDADLFRILQPKRFGGYEYGFDVFVEAVATVAGGDGSTGWVYSLGAVHQWLIACFPEDAQQEVWATNPDAISAVSYAPTGSSQSVDGGYRISGRWSFASGCDNVDWAILGGRIPTGDGGMQPGFFLIPKAQYTIDDDWFTAGLSGTGSKTIVVDDQFVPAHRAVPFAPLLAGNPPGAQVNRNPLYRLPFLAVVPTCLVGPALGMARGARDVFLENVRSRVTRGAVAGDQKQMADFQTIQIRAAEATAAIDAAELLIFRDLRETVEAVTAGATDHIDLRLRNRRDHAFATRLLMGAVDRLFEAAGGAGLSSRSPLQRFWRDIHGAGSHISLNGDAVASMYGQHLFGLDPQGQY